MKNTSIIFVPLFILTLIGCTRQHSNARQGQVAQERRSGESDSLPPHMVRVCNVGEEDTLFYCYRGDLAMVAGVTGVGGDWRCATWDVRVPDRVFCYVGKPISVRVAGQSVIRRPQPPGTDPHILEFASDEHGTPTVRVTP